MVGHSVTLARAPHLPETSPQGRLRTTWGSCLPTPLRLCVIPEATLLTQALSEMDEFKNLDNDIEGSAKRWKKLVESEAPEKEIFPKEWKNKTALQKLCMVRCMRPDRMTYAVK